MKVIILAAGMGSRLRPLTDAKPKSMVKVNGIPIIDYQIRAYLNAGVSESDIYVAVGYRSEIISNYVKSQYPEINIIVNKNYKNTNNMFSLYLCLTAIEEDDIIISNGDCIYDFNIIREFINCGLDNSIACDKGYYSEENMKIIVQGKRILHISKEIKQQNAYGTSIDLYKISKKSIPILKSIINEMISSNPNLWMEFALDKLFQFVEFNPFNIDGKRWMEIDTLDDLLEAERKFSKISLKDKKSIIFDLDGTVYLGEMPIKGTVEFIIRNSNIYDIYFMTNNTSKKLDDYVLKLNKLGIDVSKDKILSPLLPLVEYLRNNEIFNIYPLGNENFKKYIKDKIPEIVFTDDGKKCQALIVAYDTELTYDKLRTASLLLKNPNIQFFATHEDLVCPTEYGNIPDAGAILKLLEVSTGRKPTIVFGKPNKILLEPVLKKYLPNEIVIVGDRIYTDMALAKNAGIDFILVLSGETKRVDVENLDVFPELILKDCGELM
ncbi:MAG: HAD-IIA family hydrolase [Candidatus Aenigmatarchaeota archaeon]